MRRTLPNTSFNLCILILSLAMSVSAATRFSGSPRVSEGEHEKRVREFVEAFNSRDIDRHIYKPARMTGTASEPEEHAVADRSIGYTRVGSGGLQPNTDSLPYRGTSAGGGYSTVEDLLKFATALQTHKLLNAQYAEMLTTGKTNTPRGKYAFGFQDDVINGTRCFGHGGGAPGMNGELKICPGPGYVIAVLSNMDPPAASRVADFITNRLPVK